MILHYVLSFLLHNWGWVLAGLGVLMVVGFVLNPAAALELVGKLAVGIPKLASRAMDWLRKPHDWWRIGCLSLAAVAATFALYAHGLQREIIIVREQGKVAVAACKVELDKQETATRANAAALDTCKTTLTAEVGKRKAVEKATAKAIQDARENATAAERELTDWQKLYNKKPATCSVALQNMEAACSSLADY